MIIALGSTRTAKVMAVRAVLARLALLDPAWGEAEIVARPVETDVSAMPRTDEDSMRGARERASAVREVLTRERIAAHFYVGLEGGLHTLEVDGEPHTLLRGWAYVTDGVRESFGCGPSITVPAEIVRLVVGNGSKPGRELGEVIDEVTGERDVRSRQGAWGVFSRNLLTREMSFEAALLAALAPFYNSEIYSYQSFLQET